MTLLEVDRAWASVAPDPDAAFEWWYADAVDAAGDGLVLICGRLPFFSGAPPMVNLALYHGGRESFWALEQHEGFESRFADEELALRFGPNSLTWGRDGRIRAALDLHAPGERSRLTARLEMTGTPLVHDGAASRHPHRWLPFAPVSWLRCSAELGGRPFFSLDAPGYVDRNLGARSLRALGLRAWRWARVREGGRCGISWTLEGDGGDEQLALAAEGALLEPSAPVSVALAAPAERGPFYARWVGADGPRAFVAERCDVVRLGRRWHEPLVRMRMHRANGAASPWAPLFCGRREGRLRRLLRLPGRGDAA